MSSQDWAPKIAVWEHLRLEISGLRSDVGARRPTAQIAVVLSCIALAKLQPTTIFTTLWTLSKGLNRFHHILFWSCNITQPVYICNAFEKALFRRKILKLPSSSVTIIAQLVSSATSFRIERQVLPSIRPRYLHRLRYKFLSPGQTPRHHLLRM